MVSHFHDWLVGHPITQNCIIALSFGLVFLLRGKYWNEIAALVRLPPQKFGNWRRSAKIEVITREIERVTRAHGDIRYFLHRLVRDFAYAFGYLGIAALSSEGFILGAVDGFRTAEHSHKSPAALHVELLIRLGAICICVLPVTRILQLMLHAVNFSREVAWYPSSIKDMQSRIEELKRPQNKTE